MEYFKTFFMYIRDGFPINMIKFLRNPAKYEIMEVDNALLYREVGRKEDAALL